MCKFLGKRYFVYGDGLSGRAACRAIKAGGGKAKLYSDDRGVFVPPRRSEYDGGIISPGIKPSHAIYEYCRENGIPVMGEPDIGFALADGRKTVGVTGTNGKTTVTRLVAQMTDGIACGNIGYPISTAACDGSDKPLVSELSSFQLHTAKVSPSVAVITNVAPDHIDWHGGFAEYCADKCNIARYMDGGALVIGEDVPLGALDSLETTAEIVYCSTRGYVDGAYIKDGYFMFEGVQVCPLDYLRLKGEHNVKNALCAIAAAMLCGADGDSVRAALSRVSADAHRVEDVGVYCGKRWVDDSKGTNVSASMAAVEATDGRLCLILGGRGKATDFSPLFERLSPRVVAVVAMGETAQAVRDCAVKFGYGSMVTVTDGLKTAVAAANGTDADTVLLSPACASFDEFGSYAERGEKYAQYVKSLK